MAISEYFRLYRLGIVTFELNKEFKNKVTSKIIQAKHKNIHSAFRKYQSDTKNTWSLVKSRLSKSVDKCPIRITVNNVLITEKVNVANQFNEFFNKVSDNLDSSLQPDFNSDPRSNIHTSITSLYVVIPSF